MAAPKRFSSLCLPLLKWVCAFWNLPEKISSGGTARTICSVLALQEPSTKRVRPLARVTSLANLISPVRNGAVRRFGQTIQVKNRATPGDWGEAWGKTGTPWDFGASLGALCDLSCALGMKSAPSGVPQGVKCCINTNKTNCFR